ncbi:MAG: CBS domain-containing protein [Gemmataceae bacterium]|nr:CBS domain-containing protein [Gemmata sp.]MDW8198256.1 CBS domain-containing protein [Gemmataceae bacterium]
MYCPACGYDKNPPGADQCAHCGLALTQLDTPIVHGPVEASLMNDPVAILKPRPPLTVPRTATLGEAMSQMITGQTGAVLITGAAGELVGILTERDFLTKIAGQPDYHTRPVSEFMTPQPETVRPTDILALALSKMDAGGYRHLPVVDGDQPVGMISVRDILRHILTICPDGV